MFIASIGWINRIITAAIQIISIPLIIRVLGNNNYAVFAIITGLMMWYNLGDFGLGPSIQNEISRLRVVGENVNEFLRSIAIYIVLIGVLEVFVFSCGSFFLQDILLRKIPSQVPYYLLAVVGDLYILMVLFSIAFKIFFAEQRGYWAYIYQTIGVVGALIVVLVLIFLDVPYKLLWISLGWIVPQTLAALAAFLHVVPLSKWFSASDFKRFYKILSFAWRYNINTIGAAFVLGIDYIIMSQIVSANDIIIYNIFNKVYLFISFGYSTILAALWPVMAEAAVVDDPTAIGKVNKMLLRNIFIGIGYILLTTLVILTMKKVIIGFFAGAQLMVSGLIIILFGIYYSIRVWVDTYNMAILSRNKITFIAATVPIQAAISIVFLYYFGTKFGIEGIVFGFLLCFLVTAAWILPCYYYSLLPNRRKT